MTAATVQTFTFKNEIDIEIRTITKDGRPWFVAKDVCDALGYAHAGHAVKRHCKSSEILKGNETVLLEIPSRGLLIVNEPDMYRLIVNSKLPSAEKFEQWVMEPIKRQYIENGRLVVTVEIEKLPPKGQQFDVHTKTPRLAWTCFIRPDPFRVPSGGCFNCKAYPGMDQQIYTPGA